jgi:carotenoid cleavage dioxygenase-like enzyme
MKDAASTDVIVHAGVAVASFYQCGDLYLLDPLTLDDLGKCSWGGSFPGDLGVSAHTKVDDRTGELLFFNYSTTAPYLHYGVVDAGHHLVHYVPVDLPGPRLPHDMAFTEQDLSEACTEFGTINSGFGERPYRYTYAATNEPGWFLFNGLVKHDTLTGREESYQFEPGVFCSEVGVAPRVGGTGEDDAYLVTLTVDMNRDLSECVVFRADDVGRGPIARAQLPERIASGTHSCWAPGDSLRGWA